MTALGKNLGLRTGWRQKQLLWTRGSSTFCPDLIYHMHATLQDKETNYLTMGGSSASVRWLPPLCFSSSPWQAGSLCLTPFLSPASSAFTWFAEGFQVKEGSHLTSLFWDRPLHPSYVSCLVFIVNLTQHWVILEEEASSEELLPADWQVAMSIKNYLDWSEKGHLTEYSTILREVGLGCIRNSWA